MDYTTSAVAGSNTNNTVTQAQSNITQEQFNITQRVLAETTPERPLVNGHKEMLRRNLGSMFRYVLSLQLKR